MNLTLSRVVIMMIMNLSEEFNRVPTGMGTTLTTNNAGFHSNAPLITKSIGDVLFSILSEVSDAITSLTRYRYYILL